MTSVVDPYRVKPGEAVNLTDWPTRIAPQYGSKSDYKALLAAQVKSIAKLQRALYAERKSALLVVLQAPDAGGKDGAVRHVFSGVNPQGCRVQSFKPPSEQELRHDFLWRASLALPERGVIGVFNRSYYEEALVVRVHPDLLEAEGVDPDHHHGLWRRRFQSIREYEAHLGRSETRVLKIYLHLSKAEQRRRFLARIAKPKKHWKLDPADIEDRARWDDYIRAYEACLQATSTDDAPWYVIPADDKRTARLLVGQAVLAAMESLNPAYQKRPNRCVNDWSGFDRSWRPRRLIAAIRLRGSEGTSVTHVGLAGAHPSHALRGQRLPRRAWQAAASLRRGLV